MMVNPYFIVLHQLPGLIYILHFMECPPSSSHSLLLDIFVATLRSKCLFDAPRLFPRLRIDFDGKSKFDAQAKSVFNELHRTMQQKKYLSYYYNLIYLPNCFQCTS